MPTPFSHYHRLTKEINKNPFYQAEEPWKIPLQVMTCVASTYRARATVFRTFGCVPWENGLQRNGHLCRNWILEQQRTCTMIKIKLWKDYVCVWLRVLWWWEGREGRGEAGYEKGGKWGSARLGARPAGPVARPWRKRIGWGLHWGQIASFTLFHSQEVEILGVSACVSGGEWW